MSNATPNPYAFLSRMVMQALTDQKAAEKAAKNPHLTLVSTTERTINMETEAERSSNRKEFVIPLHQHGAFNDIDAASDIIAMGADALKGISAMMQPITVQGDGQNPARISEISAVFRFFGEVLSDAVGTAQHASERLQRECEKV